MSYSLMPERVSMILEQGLLFNVEGYSGFQTRPHASKSTLQNIVSAMYNGNNKYEVVDFAAKGYCIKQPFAVQNYANTKPVTTDLIIPLIYDKINDFYFTQQNQENRDVTTPSNMIFDVFKIIDNELELITLNLTYNNNQIQHLLVYSFNPDFYGVVAEEDLAAAFDQETTILFQNKYILNNAYGGQNGFNTTGFSCIYNGEELISYLLSPKQNTGHKVILTPVNGMMSEIEVTDTPITNIYYLAKGNQATRQIMIKDGISYLIFPGGNVPSSRGIINLVVSSYALA